MSRSIVSRCSFLSVLLLVALTGSAGALDYDEAVAGDLSDAPDTPTPIFFEPGSNVVSGTLDGSPDVRDFLTFELAPGQSLAEVILLQYEDATLPIPGNTGFHAINAGATSAIPSGGTISFFLGGDHINTPDVGLDVLAFLADAPLAGTGFTPPLAAGAYSYLIQQTSPTPVRYALDFVVVPEPGTGLLVFSGLALLARRPRRLVR